MLNREELYPNESVSFPVIGDYKSPSEKIFGTVICDNGKFRQKFRKVNENVQFYAVIEDMTPQICPIIAMNMHGLIFDYVDTDLDGSFEAASKLSILQIGNGFGFEGIPFSMVSETEVVNKYTTEFRKTRRCTIEFLSLSMNQRKHLELCIQKFTSDFAN